MFSQNAGPGPDVITHDDNNGVTRGMHQMPPRHVRPGHIPPDPGYSARPQRHPGTIDYGYQHPYYSPPPQQWAHPRLSQFIPPQMRYRPHPHGYQPPPPGYHGYLPQPCEQGAPPPQPLDADGRRICEF